jgi:hypothetical protein
MADNISVSLFCRGLCRNLLLPAGSFFALQFALFGNVLLLTCLLTLYVEKTSISRR